MLNISRFLETAVWVRQITWLNLENIEQYKWTSVISYNGFTYKILKKVFNLHTSLEACCHENSTNSNIVYFEHYFAGVLATPWYLRSAAHHNEMSLERRDTCAAHRSHSSTVATSILTVERQTDFWHILNTCCV